MLDPRIIWIGASALLAAYFGYHSLVSTGTSGPTEHTSYITEKDGTQHRLLRIDRGRCLAEPNRLWATAGDYVECIQYVTPPAQPAGTTAVVFFSGDVAAEEVTRQRMEAMQTAYRRRAELVAKGYGVPVYVVGRPGLMGSSGSHILGGQRDESQIIGAALDQLKRRHGLQRLVLGGQSGGARLVAQLLTTRRSDVDCAVMASGAYGIPLVKGGGTRRTNIWGDPGQRYLVPIQNIGSILHDGRRRNFVIGDPRDTRTPFEGQREWALALQQAGHKTILLEAVAGGKEHHFLSEVGIRVAGLCAAGKSDGAISDFVRLSKRRKI
ncbi:MAG: hypothetical protein RLZ98_720 [Pseudomonadota bacterium]|jgi:predicted esterase